MENHITVEMDELTSTGGARAHSDQGVQVDMVNLVDEDDDEKHDVGGLGLIYGVLDTPPIHITIICGLQQALLSLATQLVISLLVADAVCAENRDDIRVKLFSSTLFMNGVTTIAMVILGTRLPLFQGAAVDYILPLLILGGTDTTFCNSKLSKNQDSGISTSVLNITENATRALVNDEADIDLILFNIKALSGSLMLAGTLHAIVGFTGIIGILLRFVGPITIVSFMMLALVYITQAILPFVQVHWAIALSTTSLTFILSLYLAKYNMPVPIWTPSLGFRIIRYPVHKIFSILISILINWLICGILTTVGAFSDDPTHPEYKSRTDARSDVIYDSPWFNLPYPGQWGGFGYSTPAFVSCLIATVILDSIGDYYACAKVSNVPLPPFRAVNRGLMIEGQWGGFGYSTPAFVSCLIATVMVILDSIGDYYACAKVSNVPPPPSHAVNRGIMIEGLCTFVSGTLGCGHATGTYGGNIGAIGLTKVASRQVFLCTGIFYLLFGLLGKFSAVFVTIPYPVLGGASVAMFSALFGVVTSNLQSISLSSSRNMAVLGLSIMLGIMVPNYINNTDQPFNTGNEQFDKLLGMILGNPMFPGTMLALFLDNTVPGTKDERGISAWRASKEEEEKRSRDLSYSAGYEVYLPLLPRRLLECDFVRYVPFLPKLKKVD